VSYISGKSFQDTGAIFTSVMARGKLQGDDMLQLTMAGVPVLSLLARQTGKTSAEVSQMVSKGQICVLYFG
ncbi:tape measure protein, partial [Klebsiella pneumoniae]|uniref:tape measure protein n=1 Tax=Klebsiella pneumoniae TaxID=573 RepID=UPI00197ACBC7